MEESADRERGGHAIVAAVALMMLSDVIAVATIWGALRMHAAAVACASSVGVTVLLANWLYSGDPRARQPFLGWLAAHIVLGVIATGFLVQKSMGDWPAIFVGYLLAVLGVRFLVYGLSLLALLVSRDVQAFLAYQAGKKVPVATPEMWVVGGIVIALPILAVIVL